MSRKSSARRLRPPPLRPTPGTLHAPSQPPPAGCFLRIEDEPAFKGMLDEYVATYCPRHRDELDLLTEAVYAKFRQTRVWLAETGQLEIAIALHETELRRQLPTAGAHGHLANGFAHSEKLVQLYLRYSNQLHRHYLRCLKELRDLQASRRLEPPSHPIQPIEANPKIEHPAPTASEPSPEPSLERLIGVQQTTDSQVSPSERLLRLEALHAEIAAQLAQQRKLVDG